MISRFTQLLLGIILIVSIVLLIGGRSREPQQVKSTPTTTQTDQEDEQKATPPQTDQTDKLTPFPSQISQELVSKVRLLISEEDYIGPPGACGVECDLAELQRLGPSGIQALIHILRTDEDSFFRSKAASFLGSLGDRQALEPLLSALKDPDEGVRGIAAAALGNLGFQDAYDPLQRLSQEDPDSYVRQRAQEALLELQPSTKP